MSALFIDEIDGPTFETENEAQGFSEWEAEGPVWTNYGGWVA